MNQTERLFKVEQLIKARDTDTAARRLYRK